MAAGVDSNDEVSLDARDVVLIGIVALAVAMGIGRFAFTPLMPLMMRDGTIDAAIGAKWATANYAGYLVGSLAAGRLWRHPMRSLQGALLGVAATTLLIAFVTTPIAGAALRFAAGVFSAWVLVLGSSWCLVRLSREGDGRRGVWIYTGVGFGIAVAGVLTWLGGNQPAARLWLELGVLATGGAWYVIRAVPHARAERTSATEYAPRRDERWHADLVICYAAFGFGYIVPATFLPTLARAQIDNPLVFGLVWPVFGLASVGSLAIAARAVPTAPRRRVWAVAQAIMAIGTGMPAIDRHLWSLGIGAALVGGTFMVTTMAGLQLARELAPANPTPLLARMTAGFAVGQIAGPMLVWLLGLHPSRGWTGTTLTSAIAAALLLSTATWLWWSDRNPLRAP